MKFKKTLGCNILLGRKQTIFECFSLVSFILRKEKPFFALEILKFSYPRNCSIFTIKHWQLFLVLEHFCDTCYFSHPARLLFSKCICLCNSFWSLGKILSFMGRKLMMLLFCLYADWLSSGGAERCNSGISWNKGYPYVCHHWH